MIPPLVSRLYGLPVDDKIFLMDNLSGKWVFLDQKASRALSLISLPASSLSPPRAAARDAFVNTIKRFGLGAKVDPQPNFLNTLILKLTKICNYRCAYCYDLEDDDSMSHMSYDVAAAALDQAIQLARRPTEESPQADLTVILHGGEPMLVFPMIKRLVALGETLAAQLGKRVVFGGQTNLSRLTQEIVDFSKEHKISWGVSLDGDAAVNDSLRVLANGKGTYKAFENAMREFPEFTRTLGVLSVITSSNDSRLLPIATHFRELGMRSWQWSLFFPIGQGRGNQSMKFSVERLINAWDRLFAAVESGEFDGMHVGPVASYLENMVKGPGTDMCMRKECGAARDLLSVSSDGRIEACDCIDRHGPLADLGLVQIGDPQSLQAARDSSKAETIRSRNPSKNGCENCIWLTVCGGTCLAHAGSIDTIWKDQCAIAMNAFTRITSSLGRSDALMRYWTSLQPIPRGGDRYLATAEA